ncbi:hypothetical protein [Pseudactinotalea suaedae]|uniref:hypothetical protein n=1 Tax=Pseudactinotalea suaedae TaxID=1524924 RepID=UPI0012E16811|nr:hypothetical protein [Pseudactinotalea suaedae]
MAPARRTAPGRPARADDADHAPAAVATPGRCERAEEESPIESATEPLDGVPGVGVPGTDAVDPAVVDRTGAPVAAFGAGVDEDATGPAGDDTEPAEPAGADPVPTGWAEADTAPAGAAGDDDGLAVPAGPGAGAGGDSGAAEDADDGVDVGDEVDADRADEAGCAAAGVGAVCAADVSGADVAVDDGLEVELDGGWELEVELDEVVALDGASARPVRASPGGLAVGSAERVVAEPLADLAALPARAPAFAPGRTASAAELPPIDPARAVDRRTIAPAAAG